MLLQEIINGALGAVTEEVVTSALEKGKEQYRDKQTTVEFPELKIVKYKNKMEKPGKGFKKPKDINIFIAPIEHVDIVEENVVLKFKPEIQNKSEWVCVTYKFENVGSADILCLYVSNNNQKSAILCDVGSLEFYINNGMLNYAEMFDRIVRVGESFSLRVCYHKDFISAGVFSVSLTISMEDRNGLCWAQGLFAPDNKIYQTRAINYKEYKEGLRVDKALECFKKPWLW